MPTQRILSDLEISQTPDELVIRGRRKSAVLWVVLTGLLVPFSIAIACQNLVGDGDVAPIWSRSPGERVAVSVSILLVLLFFVALPIVLCFAYLRRRRRPWVFDRRRGQLTRRDRSWPLAEFTAVVVDVRRGEGFFRGTAPESAAVMLHSGDGGKLELARFHAGGKGPATLQSRMHLASELANVVAEFLQLPVRHPAPVNQGFEVVIPASPRGGHE